MAAEATGLIDFKHCVNSSNFDPMRAWDSSPVPWHWWQILLLVLAISGFLGNALVLMVLLRPKHKRSSTDTLIVNLALADLITCLAVIPHPIVDTVPDSTSGYFFCTIVHLSYVALLSTEASILTLMTISVERFVAVVHPYTFDRTFTRRKTLAIIASIWVFSTALNSSHFFIVKPNDCECKVHFSSDAVQTFLGIMSFCCRFCLPTGVMVVTHALTIREIRRRSTPITRSSWCRRSRRTRLVRIRRRVIATLFVIIVVFIVCWTPDQLFFLFCNLGVIDRSYIFNETHRKLLLLGFISSISNVIIYAALNPRFRLALRDMFQGFGEVCHLSSCYQAFVKRIAGPRSSS